MAKPIITVLVDTYNHERFIEQALSSVVEQDFPATEMEILVVDDGSTDRTPELIRRFEPRVRLIRKENGGQASAFNTGIPEARGEIVAFLDGDDWWARNKVTRVAEAMAAEPGLGIVGHGITIVHPDGREELEILREGFRFQANTDEGALLLRRRGAFLGTSRMTIRAEVLRRIGAVPEAIRVQADEHLFTLACALAGAHILQESLTFYRLHDANAFQIGQFDAARLRHKQESLDVLAKSLDAALERQGIGKRVRETVVAYSRASADRLRLTLDGGWPWETASTEWMLYHVAHPEAPFSHRTFKMLALMGALIFPPKAYYRMQSRLSGSRLYRHARKTVLPVPQMPHIHKQSRAGS